MSLEDGFWSSKEVEKVALTFIHPSEVFHALFHVAIFEEEA
jgi:hypothetical protein